MEQIEQVLNTLAERGDLTGENMAYLGNPIGGKPESDTGFDSRGFGMRSDAGQHAELPDGCQLPQSELVEKVRALLPDGMRERMARFHAVEGDKGIPDSANYSQDRNIADTTMIQNLISGSRFPGAQPYKPMAKDADGNVHSIDYGSDTGPTPYPEYAVYHQDVIDQDDIAAWWLYAFTTADSNSDGEPDLSMSAAIDVANAAGIKQASLIKYLMNGPALAGFSPAAKR